MIPTTEPGNPMRRMILGLPVTLSWSLNGGTSFVSARRDSAQIRSSDLSHYPDIKDQTNRQRSRESLPLKRRRLPESRIGVHS